MPCTPRSSGVERPDCLDYCYSIRISGQCLDGEFSEVTRFQRRTFLYLPLQIYSMSSQPLVCSDIHADSNKLSELIV